MRADTIDVSRSQQWDLERPGPSTQIECAAINVRSVLPPRSATDSVPHSCSDMFEQVGMPSDASISGLYAIADFVGQSEYLASWPL